MKWIADTSGRFGWRPFYDQEELDNECEQIVSNFLLTKNGAFHFPISTDDLCIMIEQDASDLDLYADLSGEGPDVEGVTEFIPHKKPAVRIAQELSVETVNYHRLRTTLAHEYGHVRFHTFLWEGQEIRKPASKMIKKLKAQQNRYVQFHRKLSDSNEIQRRQRSPHNYELSMTHIYASMRHENDRSSQNYSRQKSILDCFGGISGPRNDEMDKTPYPRILMKPRPGEGFYHHKWGSCFKCSRGSMLEAPYYDWMEWQASYIGGAILMPLSALRNEIRKGLAGRTEHKWVTGDSSLARDLSSVIAEKFDVSSEAARVRLTKLGVIQEAGLKG
jgi:hypothetical protein